jgi:transcriptional regulator with XRE-family HTH domain
VESEFRSTLHQLRNEVGLTQSELARLVGVSQATISLWENDKAYPDDVQLETLRRALSTSHPPSPVAEEMPEGLDTVQASGWGGEYPLDAVFVRTDQRTVQEVVRRIQNNRYDLNPDFQRDFVWSASKQSRLIESCIMRIPLPVLYVAEATDGRIIVVDGLQRLSTFTRFLDNQLKLSFERADDVPPHPLEGKRFRDLDLKLQERVEDTQLTLYILDSKAPERAKLDIFDRVNSGEPLTRQQMRNSLYNGPATRWLKGSAENPTFLRATGESLDPRKMRDREAINRFCAFSLLGWRKYRSGDMDSFLAESLELMNKMNSIDLQNLELRFLLAMEINHELFGRHAFRKSLLLNNDAAARSVLNIAFFDVCSVVLSTLERIHIERHKAQLQQEVRNLLSDGEFEHAITYSTNSRIQVEQRFLKMESAIARMNSDQLS